MLINKRLHFSKNCSCFTTALNCWEPVSKSLPGSSQSSVFYAYRPRHSLPIFLPSPAYATVCNNNISFFCFKINKFFKLWPCHSILGLFKFIPIDSPASIRQTLYYAKRPYPTRPFSTPLPPLSGLFSFLRYAFTLSQLKHSKRISIALSSGDMCFAMG